MTFPIVCGRNGKAQNGNGHAAVDWGATLSVPMCIESIATAYPEPGEEADTLKMLEQAGRECLAGSRFSKKAD